MDGSVNHGNDMPFYTTNTPNSTDPINVTQPLILANFQQLFDYLNVDHVALNASSQGIHQQVTMPSQVGPPSTASGELALYNKLGINGFSELWIVREGNSATDCALTNSAITAPVKNLNGVTYLAGGLLLQWGLVNLAVPGSGLQSFTPAFDMTFTPNVIINPVGATSQATDFSLNGISSTQFSFTNNTSSNKSFFWQAIGPA